MVCAHIRFLNANSSSEPAMQGIVAALQNAGVQLLPAERAEHGQAAVALFDQLTDGTLAELRLLSGGGLARVLAICPAPLAGTALAGEGVWRVLESGASDVVFWRDQSQQPREVAQRLERWQAIDELARAPAIRNNLVGKSRAWITMLREIIEVSRFSDASVLITGESGTGKELLARLVHTLDPRREKQDLVVVDCTTLARELAGSELFGHERGAYTGATRERDGAIALANNGTLFLDEVGELPLPLQAQLLRLVQERTYKRVGGNSWHTSQFRLVSATNRDLSAEVATGNFRADLYYRLTTWVCRTPSLRERPEDIMPLVEHFARMFLPENDIEIDDSVRDYMLNRDYPGNVRELRQVVQRICARHVGGGPLTVGDIAQHERPTLPVQRDWQAGSLEQGIRRAIHQGAGMREIGRAAEDLAVQIVVADEDGNLQRAARRLGVTDRALQLRRAERKR